MSSNDTISQRDLESGGKVSFLHGYITSIEKFPIIICCSILSLTLTLGIVTVLIHGVPTFDEPRQGFELRGTPLSARYSAFVKFLNANRSVASPVPQNYIKSLRGNNNDSNHDIRQKREITTRESESVTHRCPALPSVNHAKIIFEPSQGGSSILDTDHLKSICQQENKLIRSHKKFLSECIKEELIERSPSGDCCPSWSLGYAIALLNNKSSCEDITEGDVEYAMGVLKRCSVYFTSGQLSTSSGNSCENGPCECFRGRLVYIIYTFLVPVELAEEIQNDNYNVPVSMTFSPIELCLSCEEKIYKIYKDNFETSRELDDGVTNVVALDFFLKFTVFDQLLISDFAYVIAGGVMVAVIIWIYTASLVITIGSLLNMAFSSILALSIYYLVFGITFFPFTNIAALVLVIGIGADDTFVYVDLWKIAKSKGDDNEGSDSKSKRIEAMEDATRHALLTLFVTTLTTSSALFATAYTQIISLKCFSVYAGMTLVANFIYTMTWLPAVIVIQDKYFSQIGISNRSFLKPFRSCIYTIYSALLAVHKRFFDQILPTVVLRLRIVWILIFILCGLSGIVLTFVYPRLRLAEGSELALFRHNHIFEKYDQVYKNVFAFTNDESGMFFNVSYVWGILPTQEENPWNPNDFGQFQLDPTFEFEDPESQVWLLEFCQDINKQSFSKNGTHFCFIEGFSSWMKRPCLSQSESTCCERFDFPFPPKDFKVCVKKYMVELCQVHLCESYTPGIRFDQNDSINALYLHVETLAPYTLRYKPVDDLWQSISTWTERKLTTAPPGLRGGWNYIHVGIQLPLYDIQDGLVVTTIVTISIALVTAAVVMLLATRNLIISALAALTITFIVITCIGFVVSVGWELNIFESLIFTLAVGLAVDFTIHFGVAYMVAPVKERVARTRYALVNLGSSISSAALSTFTAGAFMIPASVINYSQLGTFMAVVMFFSWLFSVFLFLPLCATFGPNDDAGQISWSKLKTCFGVGRKTSRSTGMTDPSFLEN